MLPQWNPTTPPGYAWDFHQPCSHHCCLSACSMSIQGAIPAARTSNLPNRAHATLVCTLRWCMIGHSHGNNLEGHNRAHHSCLEAPPLRAPHLHRRSFWNALPQTEPAAWHRQGQDRQEFLGTSENAEQNAVAMCAIALTSHPGVEQPSSRFMHVGSYPRSHVRAHAWWNACEGAAGLRKRGGSMAHERTRPP